MQSKCWVHLLRFKFSSVVAFVFPGSITNDVHAEASLYRYLCGYFFFFFQNLLRTVGRWPNMGLRHTHLDLPLFGLSGKLSTVCIHCHSRSPQFNLFKFSFSALTAPQMQLPKTHRMFCPVVSKYCEILRQRLSFLCLLSILSRGIGSFLRTVVHFSSQANLTQRNNYLWYAKGTIILHLWHSLQFIENSRSISFGKSTLDIHKWVQKSHPESPHDYKGNMLYICRPL